MIKYVGFETNIPASTLLLQNLFSYVACWGWGEMRCWKRRKILKLKQSLEALIIKLWRKESSCYWGRNPQDEVSFRVRVGEEKSCLSPCCPTEGPTGALTATVTLSCRGNLPVGRLLKAIQSIRWHIREQKAISATGLLLLAVLITSSRLSASQTDFYSLSQRIFLNFFFFLATQTLCSASFGWKI